MKIDPALSAEEWAYPLLHIRVDGGSAAENLSPADFRRNIDELPGIIALANDALPDTDPRKITRAIVARLRRAADYTRLVEASWKTVNAVQIANEEADKLLAFADALDSYLPPERA